MKTLLLALIPLTLQLSTSHATQPPLTPFERLQQERSHLSIDVTDADVNDLIPRILERTDLQYTFIRSGEERFVSLKTKADPMLVLETVAFAAGFNIHKNGSYWVIHPLAADTDVIR